MTNRERVRTALEHRQPDRVPYSLQFTAPAREKMAAWYGDRDFESRLGNCFAIHTCHPKAAWQEVEPGIVRDHFGMIWDKRQDKDIGMVMNRAVTPENVDTYPFPDPANPLIWEPIRAAVANRGDTYVVAQLGFSLFERSWGLAGMPEILMAMAADPAFVNRLLDRILEYNLQVIERACALGVDAMLFGDDWGCQRGLMMGPARWREFIAPRAGEMYRAAKRHGKTVLIHCCGKVEELFPELIQLGVDVFNPFQPEAMDVYAAKRRFGKDLCFFGGISTQRTLPYATPEQTRAEVLRLLAEVGRQGGYIAAPAHSIPADARPENIAAMIDALQRQ
jgi:uroporphyrinogen decarboxylase